MLNLKYKHNIEKDHEDIYLDNKYVGYLTFFEDPDIEVFGVNLKNFLGMIYVDPNYRKQGILKQVLNDWNVESLCASETVYNDFTLEQLRNIYQKLGFENIPNSKQFFIKKRG